MAFALAAIPAISAISGIAGAGISAAGAISGGIAAKNQANYQAQIANNNAIIAEQNAVRTEQAGIAAGENQGRKGAAKEAGIKVAQASNGVDVNTGSASEVQAGERQTDQLDTETVLSNSNLHAYGYRVQADNFEAEEALDKSKAANAVPAAGLAAAGGLLSNASSIGLKWGGGGGSSKWTSGGGDPVYPSNDI